MANVRTSVPLSASVSNVRTQSRTGSSWKGFAAGRQPNSPKAAANKAQWGYATRSWPNLSPSEQAAWNAIAPPGMSGYATFVQATMRQAKLGNYVPPTAPASYPTYPNSGNSYFTVSGTEYQAVWNYAGTAGAYLNIQISRPRTKNQLYITPKNMLQLVNADATLNQVYITTPLQDALGFLPQQVYLRVVWTVFDVVSGLPTAKITNTQYLNPLP